MILNLKKMLNDNKIASREFLERHESSFNEVKKALKDNGESGSIQALKQLEKGDFGAVDLQAVAGVYNDYITTKYEKNVVYAEDVKHAQETLTNVLGEGDYTIEKQVGRRSFSDSPYFQNPFGESLGFDDYEIKDNQHIAKEQLEATFSVMKRVNEAREVMGKDNIRNMDDVMNFEHNKANNTLPSDLMRGHISDFTNELERKSTQSNRPTQSR